jgi:serine/threonine-protein kinase
MDLEQRSILDAAEPRFATEGELGSGGMGDVLLVKDRDLRRQVAVKVLRGEDEELRLAFLAEAQATSQLEHPGVPPVHDIGLTADGRHYFSMQVVRGRTLGEAMGEHSLHRLVTILERIAETLHFAHERGVIHRDLKPDNVMLGDYGEVYVVDWGLVRVGSGADVSVSDTTFDRGFAVGTPPYMSPEQTLGEPVDRRTDVYALGCVMYEVLTGRRAFDNVADVLEGRYADVTEPAHACEARSRSRSRRR